MATITHKFVSTIPDGDDTSVVRPSNWNDTHEVVIDKTDVGLGNVDNTSDANKPVSTAQLAALDAKQNTLVSGTNIKTINGDSVLGSGDIVISGSPSFNTVEIDLGDNPRRDGRFTITGLSGLTINKPVNIFQAVAPYTNKGTRADESEMDGLIVKAVVTATNTITAYWNSATRVKGNFKFNYLVGA